MQMRPIIFVVATVLLVPFVYGFSVVPDACAVPKDPNWGKTGTCQFISVGGGEEAMECCWEEPDILNPGKTITWCQRCADRGEGECGPVYLKATGKDLVVPPGGGVLQDPSTDSGPKLPEKGGFSLGPNLKFSQSNITNSNDSSTPTLEQLNVQANITENETRASFAEEKQGESDTTEEDDGQEPDEDDEDEN